MTHANYTEKNTSYSQTTDSLYFDKIVSFCVQTTPSSSLSILFFSPIIKVTTTYRPHRMYLIITTYIYIIQLLHVLSATLDLMNVLKSA